MLTYTFEIEYLDGTTKQQIIDDVPSLSIAFERVINRLRLYAGSNSSLSNEGIEKVSSISVIR